VIIVLPAASGVTSPAVTDATEVLLDNHVTVVTLGLRGESIAES
jgi:hypothetical protein